jgi:hypothetical protein
MYAYTPGDLYGLSSEELDGFHIVDPGADGESDAFSLDHDELADYLGDLYQEADEVSAAHPVHDLAAWNVSLLALSGMNFAQFEIDLLMERINSDGRSCNTPMNKTPNIMPKKNTVGVAIAQLRNAFGHDDKKQKRGKRREAATNNGWTKA